MDTANTDIGERPRTIHIGAIVRDLLVVLGITSLPAILGHTPQTSSLGDVILHLAATTIGFTFAGSFAPSRRWPHLFLVAAGVWLVSLAGMVAQHISIAKWSNPLVAVMVTMVLGGVFSYAFKRNSKPVI